MTLIHEGGKWRVYGNTPIPEWEAYRVDYDLSLESKPLYCYAFPTFEIAKSLIDMTSHKPILGSSV